MKGCEWIGQTRIRTTCWNLAFWSLNESLRKWATQKVSLHVDSLSNETIAPKMKPARSAGPKKPWPNLLCVERGIARNIVSGNPWSAGKRRQGIGDELRPPQITAERQASSMTNMRLWAKAFLQHAGGSLNPSKRIACWVSTSASLVTRRNAANSASASFQMPGSQLHVRYNSFLTERVSSDLVQELRV